MALKHYRVKKICSNCGTPYKESDPMPLCQHCLMDLAGYSQVVQNARLSGGHHPHKLPDNSIINPGF